MKTIVQKTEVAGTTDTTFQKYTVATGIIIALCLVAYFLFMQSIGLGAVPEYRIFNFLIQFVIIAVCLRSYKQSHKGNYSYLEGFGLGCFASFIGVVLFAGFMYLYLQVINPDMLSDLRNNASMMGKYLTPFSTAFAVVVEGSIAGLITSFALMQFFKDDALHDPLKKKSSEIE